MIYEGSTLYGFTYTANSAIISVNASTGAGSLLYSTSGARHHYFIDRHAGTDLRARAFDCRPRRYRLRDGNHRPTAGGVVKAQPA